MKRGRQIQTSIVKIRIQHVIKPRNTNDSQKQLTGNIFTVIIVKIDCREKIEPPSKNKVISVLLHPNHFRNVTYALFS